MRTLRAICWGMIFAGLIMMCAGMADGAGGAPDAAAQLTAALEDGGLLRLHIVADDDSDGAQRIKLLVRDALIDEYSARLRGMRSAGEAAEFLRGELGNIEQTAERILAEQGAAYGARARLGEFDFPDREYGGTVVPAGRYTALRIELGRAQGRNWWCVVYPALCALPPDVPTQAQPVVRLLGT